MSLKLIDEDLCELFIYIGSVPLNRLYFILLSVSLPPPSWFVTMQICVVSFQSWRNVFGLLLRELRPWRLH